MTAPALRDVPVPWQQALVLLGGVAATFAIVRRLLAGDTAPLLLALAGVAALLLLTRTRDLALGWLLLCATVLPPRFLPLSVGGVRTDAAELLGLGLVGAVTVRVLVGERCRLSRFAGPLSAVVLAACFGAFVAAGLGAPRDAWLGLLKTFVLYLVPVAFVALFSDDRARDRLERWVHHICTVGGGLVLLAAAAGFRVPSDETPEVVTLGVALEALRLRPPLLTLTILALLLLVATATVDGLRRSDLVRLTVYVGVIAASFTRSTWVPLVLALALLGLLRPGPRRALRGLRAGLVLVTVATLAFGLAGSGSLGATPKAITVRVQSIGSDSVLEENSYRDREIESASARQRIAEEPWRGIGLGQPYGAVTRTYDAVTGARQVLPRRFIHNSYLGIWLWTGVAGVLALTWFAAAVCAAAVHAARQPDVRAGARAVAAALALLALGLQATFQTSLTSRSVLATVACALVLLDLPRVVRSRRGAAA